MILLASVAYLGLSPPWPKNSLRCIDVMFGNGNGKEWEKPYGNPIGMGIGYKIGNGNGKEWESTAREWEEWECRKPFPGISTPVDVS